MNDCNTSEGFFQPVLQSEVVMVMCHGCGTEQPVNAVYAPYVMDGISSCRACREKMYGSSESGG
jgi:peptide methionine sulfoxide reductase MsrB